MDKGNLSFRHLLASVIMISVLVLSAPIAQAGQGCKITWDVFGPFYDDWNCIDVYCSDPQCDGAHCRVCFTADVTFKRVYSIGQCESFEGAIPSNYVYPGYCTAQTVYYLAPQESIEVDYSDCYWIPLVCYCQELYDAVNQIAAGQASEGRVCCICN